MDNELFDRGGWGEPSLPKQPPGLPSPNLPPTPSSAPTAPTAPTAQPLVTRHPPWTSTPRRPAHARTTSNVPRAPNTHPKAPNTPSRDSKTPNGPATVPKPTSPVSTPFGRDGTISTLEEAKWASAPTYPNPGNGPAPAKSRGPIITLDENTTVASNSRPIPQDSSSSRSARGQNGGGVQQARVQNVGLQQARRLQTSRQPQRNSRARRLSPSSQALLDASNANKARWVSRQRRDAAFLLPNPWRTYLTTYMFPTKTIRSVRLQTGAFVVWPTDARHRELLIYGTPEQQNAAIAQLARHFGGSKAPNPAPQSDLAAQSLQKKDEKFAKSYSTMNQEQESKHLIKEIEKEKEVFVITRFDHDSADHQGYFLWPTEDLSVEEAFGNRNRMEILDPIRNRCRCFIEYDTSLLAIRVSASPILDSATQDTSVTNAIKAIRHQLCKIIIEMNAFSKTLLKSFNVQTLSMPLSDMKVRLDERAVGGTKADFQTPVLTYQQPNTASSGSTSIYEGNSETGRLNETRMRLAVKNVLPELQFFRGQIHMRVNFGSFRLKKYRKPADSYNGTLDEFRSMLADHNTDGLLYPILNPIFAGLHLRDRCIGATDLLIPYESNAISLKEAKLVYSAKFIFHAHEGKVPVYETSFIRSDYSTNFTRESKCWYYEPETPGPEVKLDFNIIDFEKCPWNFQITAHERIELNQIVSGMRAFAESVELRPDLVDDILAESQPTGKFKYSQRNRPKCVSETTSLRFRLARDSSYVLELYRRETFFPQPTILPGQRFGLPAQDGPKPTAGWAARLYHGEWANKFGENAALRVGEVAGWKPGLTEFFPPSIGVDGEVAADATFHSFWQMVESVSAELGLKGENTLVGVDSRMSNGTAKSGQAQAPTVGPSIPRPQTRGSTHANPPESEICRYWVRSGKCKNEQNCSYKHAMATDPATLAILGLNEIPRWYREKQSPNTNTPNGTAATQNGVFSNGPRAKAASVKVGKGYKDHVGTQTSNWTGI